MSGQTTQRAFKDLLAGLQQNKLSLVDVIQALNARGQVQSPLHRAELGMLDEALAKKSLDEKMHRLLSAKLKDLQARTVVEKTTAQSAYKPPVGNDDKTTVAGGGDKTTVNPASGDATVVNTGGGGDGFDLLMGEEDEKTAMGGAGAETTGFKPQEPGTTGSRTGGTSGPNTSSWQRVAAAPAGADREVHAGDTLKDRFYLDKEVGRGGMGIVFKARDERKVEAQDKNPWVAVKVLNPEFRKHPQALVALQRESRKAQQLTHDNILRVFDFDKDQTVIYMTMEYVDGGSLKDVIKKHPNGMPFAQGWPIIAGLARGLGRAHRDNIVHSDFKPGNVMMTSDMIPKLFDMGIARAAQAGGESKGETTVFDAGELGALTPAYASLEMIQGQPPQLIDDIYALGITAYEILTGKHPFNKKNAEQAMKEGLRPPTVPGLSRTQQRTLQASVAFKRDNRIKTCDDFLDGMRPRTFKDYAPQVMGGGMALVLVLVGIFVVLLPYLAGRRVDAMIQQFATSAFPDAAAAAAALDAMKASERDTAMQKGSKEIQNYFFARAGDKWHVSLKQEKDAEGNPKTVWDSNVKDQRFDYPAARKVIDEAKRLYPDSAAVQDNDEKIEDERSKMLASLGDVFNQHVDSNRIYEDRTPNVVETASLVRQIAPDHELLKQQKLPLKYKQDVRNALEAGQFELADKRAATAVKVYPGETELVALQKSVKDGYAMQLAAAKERELRDKMTAAEAKVELAKLAANPLFTPDWQVAVNVSMSKLTADTSPETLQVKGILADAFAKQLAGKIDSKDLIGGQMVAEASSKLFGTSMPGVTKELARFNEARRAKQAEEAAKTAIAEVESLKGTLRAKAEANDLRGAQAALDKLRNSLAANDPYLTGDGPKALGEAYLRSAQRQADQGRYDTAQQLVASGLKVAPSLQGLKDADKQYRVEGAVAMLQAGASQPATANGDKLKAALEIVRTDDPTRFGRLSTDLQSGVLGRLQALTSSDPAAAGRGKTEWMKVFPQNTQLASLVIPTGVVAPSSASPSPSPSASLPSEARKARRAPGVDTCQSSFAGFGRSSKATCVDDVAGAAGPRLVVVPGLGGGAPFAITKYEIKASEFNAFCSATGKCKPQGGNDALPRTNVSLAVAKAYAAWLSETSGFTYRLPTDAEWAHAASAGGSGAGEDFQCIVMAGGSQIKGGNAIPVSTGKPNAWGLLNAIGNAAEFTDGGSARGGHFNTPTSQCTVEWRQSGGDSDTVGLRLVREMG